MLNGLPRLYGLGTLMSLGVCGVYGVFGVVIDSPVFARTLRLSVLDQLGGRAVGDNNDEAVSGSLP